MTAIDHNQDKTLKFYKFLFLLGLLVFLVGQLILAKGNEYVYNLKRIDFAHWSLLVGMTLLIPQTISFPKNVFGFIGIPLTLVGIICGVGMCVLDFIWWSFPNEEMRIEFTNHISQVPAIWKPFMTIGPSSKVFNLGLFFLSFTYLKRSKLGVLVILIANLILWHAIPVPHRLVFGYTLTFIGFSILFLKKREE